MDIELVLPQSRTPVVEKKRNITWVYNWCSRSPALPQLLVFGSWIIERGIIMCFSFVSICKYY